MMRAGVVLLLGAACLLAGLGGARGRALRQEQANPFLAAPQAPSEASPAAPLPPPVPAPAPPTTAPAAAGAAPAVAPAAEAAPAPAAAVNSEGDPCACTTTGMSGGANTTRIGCGQWDVQGGSNRIACFVNVRWRRGLAGAAVPVTDKRLACGDCSLPHC